MRVHSSHKGKHHESLVEDQYSHINVFRFASVHSNLIRTVRDGVCFFLDVYRQETKTRESGGNDRL